MAGGGRREGGGWWRAVEGGVRGWEGERERGREGEREKEIGRDDLELISMKIKADEEREFKSKRRIKRVESSLEPAHLLVRPPRSVALS